MKYFFKLALLFISLLCFLEIVGCSDSLPAPNRHPANHSTLVCNVKNYGAKGNGEVETPFIQNAVNACRGKGGTVYFPPGNYVSGTIRLGSDMTFHLDSGATLTGVRDANAFPWLVPPTTNGQLLNCRRALLYAESADNLTIEGPGIIDGSGDFKPWKEVPEAQRPMAIFIVKGTGLKIQNLQVKRAAMWAVVLMETQSSLVSGIDVNTPFGSTRDGIDIVDGDGVHVDNVTVFSEDDSICLKSGLVTGLKNVWVTNSHITGSLVANGLKFGTASTGLLQNIHFENITIEHVAQAAMAIESVDGSHIDGVTFKNIKFSDTGSAIFVLLGQRGYVKQKIKPGSISNLMFQNIDGESSRQAWGSALSGTILDGHEYKLQSITFENVHMGFKGDGHFVQGHLPPPPPEYDGQYPDPRMWPQLPAQGLYFRHVDGISLRNTRLEKLPSSDSRPVLFPDTKETQFDAP